MKALRLKITNIGKLENVDLEINRPLILLYGEVKQGKSTVLNCVRWVCGGEFPSDILTHGKNEGSIEFTLDGGMIGRSFYRAKTGETKARAVVFVKNGKPVPSPVAEIKRLLNPFLLDQDFLRNKTELERKQYFTELFAVDTAELDTEIFNSQRDAQQLRAKISGYGEIDLTPVKPVDASVLQIKLGEIRNKYNGERQETEKTNRAVLEHNNEVGRHQEGEMILAESIADVENKLAGLKARQVAVKSWIDKNPGKKEIATPGSPDTTDLENQIQDAGATNVRAEQYQKNVIRAAGKKIQEVQLSAMEKRQRDIKAEKQAKLKTISSTCGIEGLEFDEAGNFIYDGTTAGMISDSQIMRLSSELSALYPEGFGLDLIDRAESLGKSIFEFVDRAKAENKSILATIVGERPATVPENVGVFVVEDGKISK